MCDTDYGCAIYTLTDRHGESQDVVVCTKHGEEMPLINDDSVRARPAEAGATCEFSDVPRGKLRERVPFITSVK